MAVLRPQTRASNGFTPNNNSQAGVKRMSSFSAFQHPHCNAFYEMPVLPPLPRRHYSSAGYSTSPSGSADTKATDHSRIRNIRYRPVPPPSYISQIKDRRNGPFITEITSDQFIKAAPPTKNRPRQRNPSSSDYTGLDPDSLEGSDSKALVPARSISVETSSKLTVTAEMAPPPSNRQKPMNNDHLSVSISPSEMYNIMQNSSTELAIETRKTDMGTQYRPVQTIDHVKTIQRRESVVSMIPRPPTSNVTTMSRIKGGRKSSSGSEAGRSFDETTVHQSVKFYSTSAQCYMGDTTNSHSSHDGAGEMETMRAMDLRDPRSVEVASIHSSKATIGIFPRKHSIPRSHESLQSITRSHESLRSIPRSHENLQSIPRSHESLQLESHFTPVVVSAIPKLSSFKTRQRTDETKELLVSRSFETSETRASPRRSSPRRSSPRRSSLSSSKLPSRSHSTSSKQQPPRSSTSSKHHERCRRPSSNAKHRPRR